jgi:hypothetical protein
VALKGGLVIPAEPLLLVLDLQGRGFRLVPDGGDIIVSPFSKLSAEDCRQIRRWKRHIVAILEYEAPAA